jgi:hypothetical protein
MVLADLLGGGGFVPGEQRVPPAQLLAKSLLLVLEGAARLDKAGCRPILPRVIDQARRIQGSGLAREEEFRQGIAVAAVLTLLRAGEVSAARGAARALLLPSESATPEPFPGWAAFARACQGGWYSWAPILRLIDLLPLLDDEAAIAGWQRSFAEDLRAFSLGAPSLEVTVCVWEFAEVSTNTGAVRDVIAVLAQSAEGSQGELGIAVRATLAAGAAASGAAELAADLLASLLDEVPAAAPGPAGDPARARVWSLAIRAAWSAACWLPDTALAEKTLAWLGAAVPAAVPFRDQPNLLVDLVGHIERIGDLKFSKLAFARLRSMLGLVLNKTRYWAIASAQFAEAHANLKNTARVGALLDEALRLAADTADPYFQIEVRGRSVPLRLQTDDCRQGLAEIRQALDLLPEISGLDDRYSALERIASFFAPFKVLLAAERQQVQALLTDLIGQVAIPGREVMATAQVLRAFAYLDLPVPPEGRQRLSELTPPGDAEGVRQNLFAAAALHEARDEPAARRLFCDAVRAVAGFAPRTDMGPVTVCDALYELSCFPHARDWGGALADWYDRAAAIAQATQDPEQRCDAALAVAGCASCCSDATGAARWLREAVVAWQRINEWLWASPRVGFLFHAWGSILGAREKYDALQDIRLVLGRVPDLRERDGWQSRIALAFWDDPIRFRELSAPVTSVGGLDQLLSAAKDRGALPAGVLPDLLFDALKKSSILPGLGFLGTSLLVCQVAARRGLFEPGNVLRALGWVEGQMRAATGTVVPA